MSDVAVLFADQPDAGIRVRKAAWRQLRRVVSDAVVGGLRERPFGQPRVTLIGCDEALARAVEVDCDVPVAHLSRANESPADSDHVVVVLVPRVTVDERVTLLRQAHRRVRAGGVFVVIATVVAVPGEDRNLIPSMGQLIDELNVATGLAFHVDEIMSVRWASEPFVRGVVVSATSLSLVDRP